jgi:hypothetical protein
VAYQFSTSLSTLRLPVGRRVSIVGHEKKFVYIKADGLLIAKECVFVNWHRIFFVFLLGTCSAWLVPSMAADRQSCPVTRPPDPPFTPPAPYSPSAGSHEFLYGGPALWTIVYPSWHIHSGGKLPFFHQGFDWKKGGRPRLTVVARRLDGEGPLVWNELASSGFMEGQSLAGMFIVTGIDIPSSGCWEIGAQYVDTSGVHTVAHLDYTVWVEP